ncbi:MAG: YebC/PmpR family DNA-binding transcriptional regulator [Candidatus Peribacteraceae bacterium]|jgi:YebC/PmpR family DNA-binding regulatory protein|nr:YebC/PmpR family DNA-binding transcriptional regulator [bacterium]MDP6561581.1 YebC/PmpR family DNA-binding transcriptional regulator [Candidatus Peribacteraceae bacterium]|tara:strand:- start:16029 stop:16772 length:744 start_codon:yes stop_codon:yes gene_type:complete
MSGHSKWSSIKHKKGAADAKRGKIFTKHAKLIEIAAREGGTGDLAMNAALKAAVDNAKVANVPNANIDRSIKKGTGELKGEATVGVTYEAYAPGGTALIIECLTDNKNRTLPNVRTIIEKRGGKMAESGSVMFLFTQKGVVTAAGELNDDLELSLMDANVEDIDAGDGMVSTTGDASSWPKARDTFKEAGLEIEEAGMKYVPLQEVTIDNIEAALKLMELIAAIEEDEDVSDVHTNADISDEVAAQI